jgi:hypothetical protein
MPSPTPKPTATPAVSALCQYETQSYLNQVEPLALEFSDTMEVAGSTSRVALGSVVQDMQRISRHGTDPHPCRKNITLCVYQLMR